MFNVRLQKVCLKYLEENLLDSNRELKVVPASFYNEIPQNDLGFFCLTYGFYCLPTIELCEWLKEKINGRKAIEIGAGHGAICKYLDIVGTDSKLQSDPNIQMVYQAIQQPTIKYPPHVIKMAANEAVEHYKPEVVIATWVTQIYLETEHERGGNMFGIDEGVILDKVDCYIHVGHEKTHGTKRILKRDHQKLVFPWLYSRSLDSSKQVIYMWDRK